MRTIHQSQRKSARYGVVSMDVVLTVAALLPVVLFFLILLLRVLASIQAHIAAMVGGALL